MRVLDLSRLLPGPYCSRVLVDLGFEVIKVEPPGGGDWSRYIPPLDPGSGEGLLFRALNRGKKSMTLNLKSEPGRAIFLQLVATADALLESFRPGRMERLGLGYDTLAQTNRRLVYCSLSGYGTEGPYRKRAGHDLNYQGLAGLVDLTGPREGSPTVPGVQIADLTGALWAVIGILGALLERERTGTGQRMDSSLLGGALSFLFLPVTHLLGGQPTVRGASALTGGLVCYNVYAARDGYMTIGALEPEFWAAFCGAVGRADLVPQQLAPAVPGEPVYEELCRIFRTRTRQEWVEALAGVDACCEPVYSVGEALNCAPVQALRMATDWNLLPPLRLASQQELSADAGAPALGQHTAQLLAELGMDAAEVTRLQEQGII
jgi:crotonobetainyl-CoA:carnitine CoA-transferase CaiB-like acyl-CoA transferase